MNTEIILTNLPTETLAAMAAEKAELVEQHGRKTVQAAIDCGRYLIEIKSRLGHGEWLPWLEQNWQYSHKRATQFIQLANMNRGSYLEEASSVREALRMIGEAEEAAGTKRTRKPAEPPAAPPALPEVEVIDNRPLKPATQPARAMFDDDDDLPSEEPAPLPRTNTHHTAENRRTPDARETDRIGIVPPDDPRSYHDGHWYAWNEDRGRMVAVTDEEILRRADEIRGQSIVEHAVTTTPVVERKPASVSHKPGKVPTVHQLATAVGDRVHDGDWQDLWRGKLERAVESWARYKQSLTGKAKVRSMESWEAALTRIENVAHDRGVDAVCDMIEKAIANGWQGWEHETNDRKTRGMAGGRIYSQLEKAKVKYDPLPE